MERKGQKFKSYSSEFKLAVILDMRTHYLGYRETARKYGLVRQHESSAANMVRNWERIFLEEGAEGLMKERRGKANSADGVRKGRPPKLDKKSEEDLIAEYQRLLTEHKITQSMSRKGNCMDNGAMEIFFGRLKVEMFYGEKFESVTSFIEQLKQYIYYYNNERISLKLKGMSPVQFRTHSI